MTGQCALKNMGPTKTAQQLILHFTVLLGIKETLTEGKVANSMLLLITLQQFNKTSRGLKLSQAPIMSPYLMRPLANGGMSSQILSATITNWTETALQGTATSS